MKTYNIIVARYNENLDWINKMDSNNIVVYNKGTCNTPNSIIKPNIGREVESFLYHIVQHYNNLPDYLIFVQGNLFDHMRGITEDNFQENINNLVNSNILITQLLFREPYLESANHYTMKVKEYFALFFLFSSSRPLNFC